MIAQVKGEGAPLVAVHGFGVDHRIMLPLEDMVQGRSWKRIYLDLPWAEAANDTGATSPRDVADVVLAEVEEIVGGQDFAIVGNSFGAMIARHVAHALSTRCLGLATLAGVFQFDHSLRKLPERHVVLRDEGVLERAGEVGEDFAEMAVVQTPDSFDRYRRFVLPGLRGANREIMDRIGENYARAYAPELKASPFEAPSLHVFGGQDQVVGFEDGLAFRSHYVRGSFAVLDAAGHNVHLEQPAVVGSLIRDWLDRMEAARQ